MNLFRPLLLLQIMLLCIALKAQNLTQTIRGVVVDTESEMTLPGATVVVTSATPIIGTSTDSEGRFSLEGVPVGRHSIQVTFVGYNQVVLNNVLVGSAKEVILNISMSESYQKLKEVVISGEKQKSGANNDMTTVSARSFSTEETSRYAASVDDPARMAQAFAGVSSTDDLSNEIIVRGNSPIGLLWRINEVEIPSPNHFSEEGATGGGISALSVNMLGNSDFLTGAFPAEYGNAVSGVFDVKLRNGNNSKHEAVFQLGVLGTDISFEGPFSDSSNSSYLVNYRYSTLALLSDAGIITIGGDNTTFQDLALQLNFPTEKYGVIKIFSLTGLSLSESDVVDDEVLANPGNDYFQTDFNSDFSVSGISNQYFINNKTFIKSTLSYSFQSIRYTEKQIDNFSLNRNLQYEDDFLNTAVRFNSYLNKKFNVKHSLRSGIILSRLGYDLNVNNPRDQQFSNLINDEGVTEQIQAYSQWKYRFHKDWVMNAGMHYLYFGLNARQSFEPRFGLAYKINELQKLSFGFGLHSRLAPLSFYNANILQPSGISKANKNIKISKALHYVLGYDRQLNENLRIKVEAYYQYLYNIPVLPGENSTFSAINSSEGINTLKVEDDGTAENVGIEFTLERFFADRYYFLFTSSIFDSKYQMPSGKEFNTRFNSNYRFSLLGGKEYMVGKARKNLLGINAKIIWAGGNRYTPINLTASRIAQETVVFNELSFEEQVPDYWRGDLTASYRINNEKVAHVISLQVQNVTNRLNLNGYYFDTNEQQILGSTQFGLIPVLQYRIEF